MARRHSRTVVRTITAKAPAPIIRVAAPAPIQHRRRGRRIARRAGRAARGLLGSSTAQATAVLAAGALGLLQKNGVALPKLFSSLSTPANVALLAYAGGKMLRSTTLDHVATGCASVALWAYLGGAPIQGDDVLGTAAVWDDNGVYGNY